MNRVLFYNLACGVGLLCGMASMARAENPWVVYEGGEGPGKGRHVVLVSGDEEYRSEEVLPQLGKILAVQHGFKCTVLFAIDTDGTINPNVNNNIPGLEALKSADLMILFTRFRKLPPEQMQHVVDYVESGRPIIGLRTATHAFNGGGKYKWLGQDSAGEGNFGRTVLGENWVAHHGHHGKEGTRGILVKEQAEHPILRGIKDGDIFGTTDVYTVTLPLPNCEPLVLGEVTASFDPKSPAVEGKKNNPMMPVAWTKSYTGSAGKAARVFTTTMGASDDIVAAGTRRMLVNGAYWCLGMEDKITADLKVDIVGTFEPSPFRGNGYKKGVKPADLAITK